MFDDNGSFLLALFEFFLFFAWFMCLFWVLGDIFRSNDLGGGAKTLWVIFVIVIPWLGILVYLIARGHGMQERQLDRPRRSRLLKRTTSGLSRHRPRAASQARSPTPRGSSTAGRSPRRSSNSSRQRRSPPDRPRSCLTGRHDQTRQDDLGRLRRSAPTKSTATDAGALTPAPVRARWSPWVTAWAIRAEPSSSVGDGAWLSGGDALWSGSSDGSGDWLWVGDPVGCSSGCCWSFPLESRRPTCPIVVSPESDPPVIEETLRPASSSNAVITTRETTNNASAVSPMCFHGNPVPVAPADRVVATIASSSSSRAWASRSSAWSRWLS